MEKKNYRSVLPQQSQYLLNTSPLLRTLKGRLLISLQMALSPDFRLAYLTLMKSFQLTLVNLLLLLVYLLPVRVISSIKWLSDITLNMDGRRHTLVLRMRQLIFTHISLCERYGKACPLKRTLVLANGTK